MSFIRAMRAKTIKMTYDGVEYQVRVRKNRDLTTTIEFTSSHPPSGLDEKLYSFNGKLPKDVRLARAMDGS